MKLYKINKIKDFFIIIGYSNKLMRNIAIKANANVVVANVKVHKFTPY